MPDHRARLYRVTLYVVAAILLGVSAAAAFAPVPAASHSGLDAARSSSLTSQAAAKKAPAIPCATPSTTGATSATAKAANAAAASGAAWTGVAEDVHASLNEDGSVASTPSQAIKVSAAGDSPVTVRVPLSGTITHRPSKGRGTPVVNGQAQVTLNPHGTAAQQVNASFTGKLPVTVAVTSKLNGKTIPPSQINGQSGTVQVTYKLANVTSVPVSACFEGFNGQHQHITVSTPVPILASLSFTVPSQATSFAAPGAALSAEASGVSVGWTAPMFEPLGPQTQSFTLTMKASQAAIPRVTLILATVDPFSLTGKAPAASAAAVGATEAAVAKGVSVLRSGLSSLQQRVSALQNSTSPHASHRAARGPSPSRAVTLDLGNLGNSIADLEAKLGTLGSSLGKLSAHSTKTSKAADALAARVSVIDTEVADIATRISDLSAQLSTVEQHVLQEVQQLDTLASDLSDLPPRVQHLPLIQKLAADLAVAQTIAGDLSSAVTHAQQHTQAVASRMQALQVHVASLEAEVAAVQASADALAALAQRVVQNHLAAVQGSFTALQKQFATSASDIKARFAHEEALVSRAKGKLAAAVAAAKQSLASALLQGEQDVQASLSQAQAQAAQAAAKAENGLAKANFQYARLLCLDEMAVLNQLPGGSAPDVSMQNGRYLYEIKGTPAKAKRQSKRQSTRHSRQTKRQSTRHSRQAKRQSTRHSRQTKRS
jgi:hypothetical protein